MRFICGTQALHLELERSVAEFLGMEDAILYAACFDANGGVFEPLLGADDAIVADKLNHASIIDGVRLCKAKRYLYEHADMADLEAKLKEAAGARFRMIVTDGVFSMDGDVAPLAAICDLADRHRALVMVDDSPRHRLHGQDRPRHAASTAGSTGRVDIITTTFGKALGGALGGCTAGSKEVDRPPAPAEPALSLLQRAARRRWRAPPCAPSSSLSAAPSYATGSRRTRRRFASG